MNKQTASSSMPKEAQVVAGDVAHNLEEEPSEINIEDLLIQPSNDLGG